MQPWHKDHREVPPFTKLSSRKDSMTRGWICHHVDWHSTALANNKDTFLWVIQVVQPLLNMKQEINVILSIWAVLLHWFWTSTPLLWNVNYIWSKQDFWYNLQMETGPKWQILSAGMGPCTLRLPLCLAEETGDLLKVTRWVHPPWFTFLLLKIIKCEK